MRVISSDKKTAIVLFNLGGPDNLEAVRPFLFNLFKDPAIIGAPLPIRYFLAWMISKRRSPIAQEIYKKIGGKSPIVPQTLQQAQALENALSSYGQVKTFVCMRYWHPMSEQVVQEVASYQPDQVILLPLYPQFSTSTTASSLKDWNETAPKIGLDVPTYSVGCYPTQSDFIQAHCALIREHLSKASNPSSVRILFSAHGLPEKIIEAGDSYQWQVEQTSQAIVDALDIEHLDWNVSYQSRVGPLKWIGPSTDEEIQLAGKEAKTLLVVPVAFVSEHSETLVELDMEYAELAHHAGVAEYIRVPALGIQSDFIQALATLCLEVEHAGSCSSHARKRLCPPQFSKCPCS
jgi:ferrochelatase